MTMCIYHKDCPDGFTAAWAVRRAMPDVEFVPAAYGEQPPPAHGRSVILVDFSYKRQEMIRLLTEAMSSIVLDHHKTAEAELEGLENIFVSSNIIFDMSRSGAMLAWEHFHIAKAPLLVEYVQDRDLWRHSLPSSREINEYIVSFPYSFEVWDYLEKSLDEQFDHCVDIGGALLRKKQRDVEQLTSLLKRRMNIAGYDVLVANIPHTLTSEAGNLMSKDEPFAACYWDTDGGRVFSLRSREGGIDVSTIARYYGGGGHARAAGFTVSLGWEGEGTRSRLATGG